MQPLKPILKWAGSKRWLIPLMTELYEPYRDRTWVDPFCGSLALPLAIQPERALLSDINPHLINLYQAITLYSGFKPLDLSNDSQTYYLARAEFNTHIVARSDNWEEQAQLFYYLNYAGFRGLCRFNGDGLFNVPYGDRKQLSYVEDFSDYHKLFQNWRIKRHNYQISCHPHKCREWFLYLDPPYDSIDDKGFTTYSGNPFGWEQQIELIEWASKWDCPTVISNLATDRIVELYERFGYEIEYVEAPRSISCDGNRKKVVEVLAKRGF
jgi:DNA adenine methylase